MARHPGQRYANYARRLHAYLAKRHSPLAPYAWVIAQTEAKYGLPQGLLAGIAAAETTFGTNPAAGSDITSGHNAWGWGPHISFPSWQAAIRTIGRGLGENYVGQGLTTPLAIGRKYAPSAAGNDPSHWAGTVQGVMGQLGGGGTLGQPGLRQPAPLQIPAPKVMKLGPKTRVSRGTAYSIAAQLAQARMTGDSKYLTMAMKELYDATVPPKAPSATEVERDAALAAAGGSQALSPGKVLGRKYTMGGGPEAHGSRPLGNWQSDHAWDLMASPGTPVYALVDGIVDPNAGFGFRSNGSTVWGRRLTIRGAGNAFFYTHLGRYAKGIRPGRRVRKGQIIGYLGKPPGFAPHLHIGLEHGDLMDYL